MKVEIKDGKALVFTPYSPVFVKKIKMIGGARWNRSVNAWEVPEASVDSVRSIMIEVYGESDQVFATEKVDVKITVTEDIIEHGDGISIMGRSICTAWGRDTGAKISSGVDFIKGSPESGGSARHWNTEIPEGCVFIIRGVVKKIADAFVAEEHEGMIAEIVSEAKLSRKSLEDEKEALLKRISEIDRLLSKTE